MSLTLNEVRLLGNTGNIPEIRTTTGGTKVAKLSVATEHRVKKGDQWESRTDWHRVTAFGKQAEFIEGFVGKGHRVLVLGRIEYSQSETDGVTRYYTDIVADRVISLDSKTNGKSDGGHTPFDDD